MRRNRPEVRNAADRASRGTAPTRRGVTPTDTSPHPLTSGCPEPTSPKRCPSPRRLTDQRIGQLRRCLAAASAASTAERCCRSPARQQLKRRLRHLGTRPSRHRHTPHHRARPSHASEAGRVERIPHRQTQAPISSTQRTAPQHVSQQLPPERDAGLIRHSLKPVPEYTRSK